MGVLYEHWRPDLNECFYVGASWANEKKRPYEMFDRNPWHLAVQEELSAKGLEPEVRIQAWDMPKKELLELEPLQIAYWKELIGDRLTNVAKGGEGVRIDWTDELCEQQSERMTEFYQTPEGQDALRRMAEKRTGTKQPEGWSERSISWKIGNKSRTGMPGAMTGKTQSPASRKKMSESAIKRMQTEEGQIHSKSAGKKGALVSWTNPNSRWKRLLSNWYIVNVRNQGYWGA